MSKKLKKKLKGLLDPEVKGDLVYELCSFRVMLIWVFLGVAFVQLLENFTMLCNSLWISLYCAIFCEFHHIVQFLVISPCYVFLLWILPCCAIVCEFHCTSYGVMFMRKFLVLLLYNFLWFFLCNSLRISCRVMLMWEFLFLLLYNILWISPFCATFC